jgi:hypothetical protein
MPDAPQRPMRGVTRAASRRQDVQARNMPAGTGRV